MHWQKSELTEHKLRKRFALKAHFCKCNITKIRVFLAEGWACVEGKVEEESRNFLGLTMPLVATSCKYSLQIAKVGGNCSCIYPGKAIFKFVFKRWILTQFKI